MSGPAHCTGTLLVSVVTRADQGRDTDSDGGEKESEAEILLLQGVQYGSCIGESVVCLGGSSGLRLFGCVFLWVQYVKVCLSLK